MKQTSDAGSLVVVYFSKVLDDYNMIRHSDKKKRYLFISTAVIAVTFIVRVWGLTETSLWYDEVFVLTYAQQGPLHAVLGLLKEDNALPLHGLLSALWLIVTGNGEFSARYLSVLLGTVTTPLVIRLGGTLSRTRYSGYGSGIAYATLPIFVYYTQEVRMYALAIPLATAFAWMAIRLSRYGKNTLLYTVTGIIMLASHIYTGLLWAVCLVWGLMMICLKKQSNGLSEKNISWLRANAFMLLGFLPVAVWAVWRVNIDATATSAIPIDVIRWIPVTFGIGQYIPSPWAETFIVIACLSLCIGFIKLIRNHHFDSALWIGLSLVLPVLFLLLATLVKAKWSERYLLPSFGLGLVTSIGLGWDIHSKYIGGTKRRPYRLRILQIITACLFAVWVAGTIPAIKRQSTGSHALLVQDEWHPRPDFRAVAHYIEDHDTPDDTIVVVAGYAAHTLAYYYDGPATLTGLPLDTRILNTRHSLDLNSLHALEQETHNADTLWLILWQNHLTDPTSLIESMLVASCKRLPVSEIFTNVGVLRFDLTDCRPLDQITTPPIPLHVKFRTPIQLSGYDIQKSPNLWEVDLWWETTGPIEETYTVFVHLIDATGQIVAQHDHIAGADAYPTSQWNTGTALRDRFFLEVPGDGCDACFLHVGLYTDKQRVDLENGQDTIIIAIDH